MTTSSWARLELRHLLAFSAISREGTFSGAADALSYSQSALSQQIAALERISGTPLFERAPGRSPLGLTEAGRLMLRHADALIARIAMADAELADLLAGADGPLRVGALPSVGASLLPQLFLELATAFPSLQMSLQTTNREERLVEQVETGELDIALCALPAPEGPYTTLELFSDPYLVVVSRDSQLITSERTISLEELRHLPLLAHRSDGHHEYIDPVLHAAGLAPSVVLRCDDDATLHAFVRAGVGAAVMPRLTVQLDDGDTLSLELTGFPARRIGLVYHADRRLSPMAERFIPLAESAGARLAGDEATRSSATSG